jgi:cardiolipin synthase
MFALASVCAACTPLVHLPHHEGGVTVEGAGGRLSPTQGEAVVASAVARAPDPQASLRLVSLMETLGSEPLYKDNDVRLLVDGPATYQAMTAAIAAARQYVELETYIFNGDEVGEKFAQLLIDKAAEGISVKVLYDSIGSIDAPPEFFERMRRAGIDVVAFHPANPVTGGNPLTLNNRDHRKLLVVDGAVAFTGGVNIDRNYSRASGGSNASDEGREKRGWRDTHIQIRGPAVEGCRLLFLANWQRAGGAPPAVEGDARNAVEGRDLVRILSATGGQGKVSPIRVAYGLAIAYAAERVWITQPYFAPDDAFLDALEAAAQRGVDVRIILPGTSDWATALYSSRHRYARLLKAGVRVFESRDAMVHAKTAVIDGIWSTVGSSNLDYRSFIHNDEVNAVVVGAHFGAQLEALFRADEGASDEITREGWKRRPVFWRIKETLASLATYWF